MRKARPCCPRPETAGVSRTHARVGRRPGVPGRALRQAKVTAGAAVALACNSRPGGVPFMTGRREPRHASGTTRPAWPRWSRSRPCTCSRTTSLLAYNGQAIAFLSSDPLGNGWNLFGTAGGTIDYGVLGATVIWYVLVAGHACGLVLSHDRALALRARPSRRQLPSTGCWPSWWRSPPRASSCSPRRINDRYVMRLLALLFDVPSIEAGHQYDFRDAPPGERSGEGEGGGIGTPWILAVAVLALVAVAVLVSLNPSKAIARAEGEPGYDSPHAHQRASREQLQRADPLPPPRHARSLGGQREGGLEPLSAPARIRTAVARGADVM